MAHGRAVALLLLLFLPAGAIAQAEGGGSSGQTTKGNLQESSTEALSRFRAWVNGPAGYLLSEKEAKIAYALTEPRHLTAFRHWFWERRDPSPETAANEFRETFEQRVAYANKTFGNPRRGGAATRTPGWQTPKGIVYILLGAPTRTARTTGQVYGDFDATVVEVWIYELAHGSVLELPFVSTAEGSAFLETPTNLGLRSQLDDALRVAVEGFVHNRALPFTGASPLVDATVQHSWSATGFLSRDQRGIDAQISIPLADVFGRPENGSLRVDLRFAMELQTRPTAIGARDAPRTIDLGQLSLLVSPEVFERWNDRALTIALCLPAADSLATSSDIVVTEVVSGRTIRLGGEGVDAIAQKYAVEELVGSAPLLQGNGAAFGFIGRPEAGNTPVHTMWVLRLPHDLSGAIIQ